MWTKLVAVRLFVQHICLPCKDDFLNYAASRLFMVGDLSVIFKYIKSLGWVSLSLSLSLSLSFSLSLSLNVLCTVVKLSV